MFHKLMSYDVKKETNIREVEDRLFNLKKLEKKSIEMDFIYKEFLKANELRPNKARFDRSLVSSQGRNSRVSAEHSRKRSKDKFDISQMKPSA